MDTEQQTAAVPAVAVKVGGSDLPAGAAADLLRVSVQERLDRPSSFTVELANLDLNTQQLTWSDADLFDPGAVVEIQLGYGRTKRTVLIGEITGLELSFPAHAKCLFTIRGHDRLHRFRRGRRTRSYVQAKDSEIAEKIAGDLGLGSDVQDSAEVHPYLLQVNQTDIDFLLSRARAIGYELFVDDRTLRFRKVGNAQGDVLTLSPTHGLLTFAAYLSTADQVSSVIVRGWDAKAKQALVGKAEAADVTGTMNGSAVGPAVADRLFGRRVLSVVEHPVATQNEADLLARAVLNEIALRYVRGRGTAVGDPDIRVGTVVRIEGAGSRFSGLYYATQVTHVWDGAFVTHLDVRRNAT